MINTMFLRSIYCISTVCLFINTKNFLLFSILCIIIGIFFVSRLDDRVIYTGIILVFTMHYVMRIEAKLFFALSVTGLIVYITLAFYTLHSTYSYTANVKIDQDRIQGVPNPDIFTSKYQYKETKYILIWSTEDNAINKLGEGQVSFVKNNCLFQNCFLTTSKTLIDEDYTNFHAIVLDVNILTHWTNVNLPQKRLKSQKYIFYGMVPAKTNPICNVRADDYFNWTWSYKLYSDIVHPFIEVRNMYGDIVAPSPDVEWTADMSNVTKMQLKHTKTKAVAIVFFDCKKFKENIGFIKLLQAELKEHALVLDIFGCGNMPCPNFNCSKLIDRDYYFYLVQEDSDEDDYVTKEVLKAYDYNAVPIVTGSPDYTKFLPDGSYINARFWNTEKLAAYISYCVMNTNLYESFFKWKNHYVIGKNRYSGVCELCTLLNEEVRVKRQSSYETFRKWWNQMPLKEKCYPKGAERKSDLLSYINNTLN